MSELGGISGTTYGAAQATQRTWNRTLPSTKVRPANVPDNDAAAVMIRNTYSPEVSGTHHSISVTEPLPTRIEMIKEFLEGIETKVAELTELLEQVAGGSFSYLNLQQEAEALGVALEMRWKQTPTVFSQARPDFDSPSSEASFSFYSKAAAVMGFHLNPISNIERSVAERKTISEVDVFSLARIREQAMKALRCQGNIEPERALFLLRNDVM